jgi:hypothetical protein
VLLKITAAKGGKNEGLKIFKTIVRTVSKYTRSQHRNY